MAGRNLSLRIEAVNRSLVGETKSSNSARPHAVLYGFLNQFFEIASRYTSCARLGP